MSWLLSGITVWGLNDTGRSVNVLLYFDHQYLLFSDVPVCSVMSCGGVIIIFSVLNNFSTHFILASHYSRLLVKRGMSFFFLRHPPVFCVLELWSPHGYHCFVYLNCGAPVDITVLLPRAFSLESFVWGFSASPVFTGSAKLPVCFKILNKVRSLCRRRKAGIMLSVNMSVEPASHFDEEHHSSCSWIFYWHVKD